MNRQLSVRNDGKEEAESFSAWSEDFDEVWRGFGATAEEAREDFARNLDQHIQRMQALQTALRDGTCRSVLVGWDGNPIND